MDNKKTNMIIENVTKLFLEYGIRGVTMDDIAHHLAISKKTLYEYFSDKKELVKAVLDVARDDFDKHFNELADKKANAIDEVFYFFELQKRMIQSNKPAFIYDLKKYYPELFKKFQEFKHKMIYDSIISNLIKGIEQGYYRKDLNPDIITRNTLMRFECMINSDFFTFEEYMSPDLFVELFKYHLYGIVSEKGRKIIEKKFLTTQ